MHAMDEFMDRIMYGVYKTKPIYCNCANEYANVNELRRIRREIAKGINELKSLSETKDRVDISLKEYEELKRINKDLLSRLNDAERILGMLDIPADMIQHIDPDSVKMYSAETFNPATFIRKHRFRIEFEMEEYD